MSTILRTFVFATFATAILLVIFIFAGNSLNENYGFTPDQNFSDKYAEFNNSISTLSGKADKASSNVEGVEVETTGNEAGLVLSTWSIPILIIDIQRVLITFMTVAADAIGIPSWLLAMGIAFMLFAVVMMILSYLRGFTT